MKQPLAKRTRVLILTAFVALSLLGCRFVLRGLGGPISKASYRQIALGMSQEEVEAILDGAPRSIADKLCFIELAEDEGDAMQALKNGGSSSMWASDEGQIIVTFDQLGRAARKELYLPDERGWFWRLLELLDFC